MIYKTIVRKEEVQQKDIVWCNFDYLNFELEYATGVPPEISLHANIDIDDDAFEVNDVDFYFISMENEKCNNFILKCGFKPVEKLPEEVFFLAGKYKGEVKKFY
ncbi:MAG: hypothetical protein K1X86_13685 [Ignavibacteria bacterium]|nr:hypothetical protein [Ignavibacteria bacterium]